MKKVELVLENMQGIMAVSDQLKTLIKDVIIQALEAEAFNEAVEISVSLVDNEQIKEINREHRRKDAVTDVLSFPMLQFDEEHHVISEYNIGDYNYDEALLVLGDIVISMERAKQQAMEYGHSFEREIGFLTAHSMFHLLGYDHEAASEAKIMRSKEEAVLQKLGLTR